MKSTKRTPRPAATVAVLRDGPTGLETFLIKRSGASPFMPHAHVFPGGRVDLEDAVAPVVGGDAERDRMGLEDALAYQVAAVRETFEETGILLADGEPDSVARGRLQRREASWREVAGERGWVLRADTLVYWAHWVTPEAEPRRYDTRFFVAGVPADTVGRHDDYETVDSDWFSPADALEAAMRSEIFLAPPTWRTLEELAKVQDVASALAAGRRRRIFPVEPRIGTDGGRLAILLPGDPENPGPTCAPYTRMVWRDGYWHCVVPGSPTPG